MPMKAMRRGIRISIIGTLMTASVLASVAMAQVTEVSTALERVSEYYGLWAALTVGLVMFSIWMFYREATFNRTTLIALLTESIRSGDSVSDSLQAMKEIMKGCRGFDWDSDKFDAEVQKVATRRKARETHTPAG